MTDIGTTRLKNSFNLLVEMEDVANDTVAELARQKEVLSKSRDNLKTVDKDLGTANTSLNRMLRRENWCCVVM